MVNNNVPSEPIFENSPMRMKACRHGVMLYNVNDVYIGRSFDLYGEYSESEMSFLANFVQPGQFVIDVGANIGAHTIFLLKRWGQRAGLYRLNRNVRSFRPSVQTWH